MERGVCDAIYRMPVIGMLGALSCGVVIALWGDLVPGMRVFCVVLGAVSIGLGVLFFPFWKNLSVFVLLCFTGWMLMTEEMASTEFPLSTLDTDSTLRSQQLTAMLLLVSDPVEKGERLRCDVLVISEMPDMAGTEIEEDAQDVIEDEDQDGFEEVTKDAGLWKGRMLQVYVPMDERTMGLETGDCICARFVPREPANFTEDFDYASYLKGKGFTAIAYITRNSWSICKNEEQAEAPLEAIPLGWRIRIKAEKCRKRLLQVYADYGIEENGLALVSALSLGKKELMDSETRERFASAGVAHVLAVSGMHVGIVYGFVNGVVGLLWRCIGHPLIWCPVRLLLRRRFAKVRRQDGLRMGTFWIWPKRIGIIVRQAVVVTVLWCYAFITGLPASVVRAVTMFTLSAGAVCLGRRSETWNNLFLTAFLMLCFSPMYLNDVGFQMSFMAVAAILMFMPSFTSLLGLERQDDVTSLFVGGMATATNGSAGTQNGFVKRLLKIVWRYMLASLLISIAAQLGTTPLSVYYFHRFPQWFLLANLVLVPTAVCLTWSALAFQCLAAIPFVPEMIVSKAAILLSAMLNFFTDFAFAIESLPGAIVDGLLPTIGEILTAYLFIGTVFYFLQKKTYLYSLENVLRYIRSLKYSKYLKNR